MKYQCISWRKESKFLGVIIETKLTFEKHCQEVKRKAIAARNQLSSLTGRKSELDLRNKMFMIRSMGAKRETFQRLDNIGLSSSQCGVVRQEKGDFQGFGADTSH